MTIKWCSYYSDFIIIKLNKYGWTNKLKDHEFAATGIDRIHWDYVSDKYMSLCGRQMINRKQCYCQFDHFSNAHQRINTQVMMLVTLWAWIIVSHSQVQIVHNTTYTHTYNMQSTIQHRKCSQPILQQPFIVQ